MEGIMIYSTELDKIKVQKGKEELKMRFEKALLKNSTDVVNLINNKEISFSTFFILIPILKKYNMFNKLNLRNKIAQKIYDECFSKVVPKVTYTRQNEIYVLKWIVNSASYDDGIDDDFDKIVDYAFAKLLDENSEPEVIENAVNLAFIRNSKNEFNHDLIWAIFRTGNPDALKAIAKHLKSNNRKEKEFTKTLLENAMDDGVDDDNRFDKIDEWIEENKPYLNFTGNSYNYATSPRFCEIDTKSKYMGRNKKESGFSMNIPQTQIQLENIKCFKKLDYKTQAKLSRYSKFLHDTDIEKWNRWQKQSLRKQVETVYGIGEV